MTEADNLCTVSEFGPRSGLGGRTYGYQLKKEGRLVLAPDGVRVLLSESRARVMATSDPSKARVAARHAAGRTAREASPVDVPSETRAEPTEDPDAPDAPLAGGYDYQNAKAKREHWAAERELAAFRKEAGELIEVAEHVAAFARAGATLRAGLEAWAAILPPQLVGRDEGAMRATIAEQVEQLLHELTSQIGAEAAEGQGGA